MDLERTIMEWIDQQSWLELMGRRMQAAVYRLYDSGGEVGLKIRDFLHGVPMGHSLHATMTDVPIGAYTTALALDGLEMATGKKGYGDGAQAMIGLGIAATLPTAAAGITDWHHTVGHARRAGMLHAILNSVSLVLYIASYVARRGGSRMAGRGLALSAFGLSMGAAYLGGHLVYKEKIGVNHAPEDGEGPDRFTPVLADEELIEGQMRKVEAGGVDILLVRRGKRIYAIAERCSHLGAPLSEGQLREDDSVVCPWHGSRFALEDGQLLQGPSTFNQPCYETRVRKGQIEVRTAPRVKG